MLVNLFIYLSFNISTYLSIKLTNLFLYEAGTDHTEDTIWVDTNLHLNLLGATLGVRSNLHYNKT